MSRIGIFHNLPSWLRSVACPVLAHRSRSVNFCWGVKGPPSSKASHHACNRALTFHHKDNCVFRRTLPGQLSVLLWRGLDAVLPHWKPWPRLYGWEVTRNWPGITCTGGWGRELRGGGPQSSRRYWAPQGRGRRKSKGWTVLKRKKWPEALTRWWFCLLNNLGQGSEKVLLMTNWGFFFKD